MLVTYQKIYQKDIQRGDNMEKLNKLRTVGILKWANRACGVRKNKTIQQEHQLRIINEFSYL